MSKKIFLEKNIPKSLSHCRLDLALSTLFPDYSRTQMQQWIKQGHVQIDHHVVEKTRQLVQTNQLITIQTELKENKKWEAQSIPLNILYEDEAIMIVNKPVGLIVHPGASNPDHTLVNALLHHEPTLALVPRAGIIHRLDKNTSGLLIVAKTIEVHHALIKQMQKHKIERHYQALVEGRVISGGTIDAPIARHPRHRTKMAVTANGKNAVTHYRVLERFSSHTLLSVQLETGRTHQIRVHLAHAQFPIVGDKTYHPRVSHLTGLSEKVKTVLQHFDHQALHAYRLRLKHPVTHELCEWTAPLPEDMRQLLEWLRRTC